MAFDGRCLDNKAADAMLIPEPRINHPWREIWVLWRTLMFLHERAGGGQPFVKARELRAFVRPLCLSDDLRDGVLRALKRVYAIGVVNRGGTTNKRYYLTAVGLAMMQAYEAILTEEMQRERE